MSEHVERRKRHYGALALLAVVILALFVRQRHSDIVPSEPVAENENYVDTYTVGVNSRQFNEQGQMFRVMEADYAAHYALSDESILQAPRIQSASDTGKMWKTSARNGKVRPGGNTFDLWNTVLIERIEGDAIARTDSLTFYSGKGIAKTKDEVIIDANIGQTVGVGMTANLNTEILKLNSEVRSVFEPPR